MVKYRKKKPASKEARDEHLTKVSFFLLHQLNITANLLNLTLEEMGVSKRISTDQINEAVKKTPLIYPKPGKTKKRGPGRPKKNG